MKKNLISVLALLLTALMLCSCTVKPAETDAGSEKPTEAPSRETDTKEPSTGSEQPTETSTDPEESSTDPEIPSGLEVYDDPIAIEMLRNSSFAGEFRARGDIGLSRVWDVGVKKDRFENEET